VRFDAETVDKNEDEAEENFEEMMRKRDEMKRK